MNKDLSANKILIVGAGLSGMSAAIKILDAAKLENIKPPTIEIIEASNRIGGRINSIELANGRHAELGACWLHSTAEGHNDFKAFCEDRYPDRIPEMVERSRAHTFQVNAQGTKPLSLINPFNEDAYDRFEKTYAELTADKSNAASVSLQDVHDALSPQDQNSLRHFFDVMVRNYMGADTMAGLSAQDLMEDDAGVLNPAVPTGLSNLVQCMIDELEDNGVKITTGTPIKSVDNTGDTVEIIDQNDQSHQADQVIMTVSSAVLKSGNIDLGASLSPEVMTYLDGVQSAQMTKIIAPINEATAPALPETSIYFQDEEQDVLAIWNSTQGPVLQILIGGEPAVKLEEDCRENNDAAKGTVEKVLSSLPEFSDAVHAVDFENMIVTNWNTNETTLCAYSYLSPGHVRSGPMQSGNIVFAGEAFSNHGSAATMAAAHDSGNHAGQMVFDNLLE